MTRISTTRISGRFASLAVLLCSFTAAGDAQGVVDISLRGHVFRAPATIRFAVAVERDARNRLLRIEADSPQFFRASETPLIGEQDKRLHSYELRDLPAGEYVLRAVVHSVSGVRGESVRTLIVTGISDP